MPDIKPFKGFVFDNLSVEIQDVIAPPYDEITPYKYKALLQQDEQNIARLQVGFEQGWYAHAARIWKSWRGNGVVVQDEKPALYVLHQQFKHNGKIFTRKGFIALCDIRPEQNHSMLPFYETNLQQRENRLRLLCATHAHFDQLMCCFEDDKNSLHSLLELSVQGDPFLQFVSHGIDYKLWRITQPSTIAHTIHFLAHEKVFITQGQHRLEAAIRYREQPELSGSAAIHASAGDYIPAYFCNARDESIFIQPVHRAIRMGSGFSREDILSKFHKNFVLNQYSKEQGLERLRESKSHSFLFAFPGIATCTLARLKNVELIPGLLDTIEDEFARTFDIHLLHYYILEKIFEISKDDQLFSDRMHYSHNESDIFELVQQQSCLGIFVNAPTINAISEAAQKGCKLPYQSTYFYPPLPSGMIMYSLDDEN